MTTSTASAPIRKLSILLNAVGPFLVLVFVLGLFLCLLDSEGRRDFLSVANFKTILSQTVIVAIGALGMTMIIVSGGIDLSVGSVVALSCVVGGVLIRSAFGLPAVALTTMAT